MTGEKRVTIRLNHQKVVFKYPIVLTPDRIWEVVGPGTLDAPISGSASNVVLWLKDCVFLLASILGNHQTDLQSLTVRSHLL